MSIYEKAMRDSGPIRPT